MKQNILKSTFNSIVGGAASAFNFVAGRDRKAATIFMWPSWRTDTPMWHVVDYASYVNDGFNLNALIYSAIMYKVRAMTAAPLRAWEGDTDTPERLPADNSLQRLVSRPNPHQSFIEFHSQNIVYLNISGDSFIWYDRGELNERREMGLDEFENVPLAMYDGIHTIRGYVYVPEGVSAFRRMNVDERVRAMHEGRAVPILPEDMQHTKLPNPADTLEGMGYGMSPMSSAARNTDVDNSVTHFLQLFFRRGVMVPGAMSTDTRLDDRIIARIKRQWKEIYGGYERWAEEVGIFEGGTTYQRIGLTFEEMGFEVLDDRNESRILGPFGVPPILIGTRLGLNRATYSNYLQARQAFWEDTMVPETELYQVDYQYYLAVPDEGWHVAFDFSRVPAFQVIRDQQQTQYHNAWTTGAITRNEYRRKLNLSPVDGGDVYLLQPTVIEVPIEPQFRVLDDGAVQELPAGQDETTSEGSPEAVEDDRKFWKSASGAIVPIGLKKKAL
jgi:HK97 family phage portal protein